MAQRLQLQLIDDIDGTEASETVPFALDGISYEIDLSEKNAKKFREAFELYVGPARRVRASTRRSVTGRPTSRNGQTAQIREWAQNNGYKVSSRGRIHADIVEAYEKAHA
ncbi:histone-like nucleoid-structuring protein Lsr2 [Arthrobacter sp. RAF14]|uniref:histone-like nucleoid-structuring protein Lsr2 n=1 Tax=Arthrobacter sp. RAF14 TaxID=3233051 RepID=UPI003F8DB4A6